PRRYPEPERVRADWLCGEHPPAHRRAVLEKFASDTITNQNQGQGQAQLVEGDVGRRSRGGRGGGHGRSGRRSGKGLVPAALRVLSSVKVLGEGVDTANCDSVAFCDARGSMIDIVQMVGRALRIKPGEGKIASLIVPVFLSPGETPDEMLTSDAYGTLAKVLSALRAHDTETIEHLADPRVRSGRWVLEEGEEGEAVGEREGERELLAGERGASVPARELLKFSTPRDPALLAQFVKLRVIEPENTFWRRGIQACVRYVKETGAQQLRVPYDYITPDTWVPAGFPLGTWLADQRKNHKAGRLDAGRVEQLDGLGMVWSHQDVAFEEGLTAARAWATVHGHLLPPTTAVWDGYPVGTWAKNQRYAARTADANAQRRRAGLPVPSSAGALTEARRSRRYGWACRPLRSLWLCVEDLLCVMCGDGLSGRTAYFLVGGESVTAWRNLENSSSRCSIVHRPSASGRIAETSLENGSRIASGLLARRHAHRVRATRTNLEDQRAAEPAGTEVPPLPRNHYSYA
ncbi:Helicase associated domain protein, partial [Streptomyces sp. NPDC001890]|uniref:helicase associated domain-containing protein n=1 Tax=Streptomyces sp. NPDC001890 TaxID=3364620 RepID=UPI00367E857C